MSRIKQIINEICEENCPMEVEVKCVCTCAVVSLRVHVAVKAVF